MFVCLVRWLISEERRGISTEQAVLVLVGFRVFEPALESKSSVAFSNLDGDVAAATSFDFDEW